MSSDREETGDAAALESDASADAPEVPIPAPSAVPTPSAVVGDDDATGYVVWHRKHLRTDDHLALSRAVADGDAVCPLFVFDPAFYGDDGMACDARVRFLHEAVTSLDRLYAANGASTVERPANASTDGRLGSTPLDRRTVGEREPAGSKSGVDASPATLRPPDAPGLTVGYGDPVDVLAAFVDRGWSVLTMATPTSRYGHRRDERVREVCAGDVTFLSGDGLVRDAEWSRSNWQSRVEHWLSDTQHAPKWGKTDAVRVVFDTGVTPALVDDAFDVTPTKRKVPRGTHRAATTRLSEFADDVRSYPGSISAPQDAREGTSGLSPYVNFGLLSVRQVYQHVTEHAPDCRGTEMFTSRLYWNLHYNQKLVDWPGWTEQAVNPVLERRNEDTHDPDLVEAWKHGNTGVPMVDASMRCLRDTGWLNFRMRAMCASFFAHILQQPWWIGADWYHHHLIDSDVAINYTQWQSQAGLIGKPSQRVYNPRKQVRDHDPDGEWITEWVPELAPLPSRFLDRPERTPLAVQKECGVVVGEDYPRPVVDFERRREAFWREHERLRADAARELRRPEIASRASFSGGYAAAEAIAREYGEDADDGTQVSLADIGDDGRATNSTGGGSNNQGDRPMEGLAGESWTDGATVPTGAGESAGEPSPDDRAAVSGGPTHNDDADEGSDDDALDSARDGSDDDALDSARDGSDDDAFDAARDDEDANTDQTTMGSFE
jgi:deoxyribodipyrimidine photo-lyase